MKSEDHDYWERKSFETLASYSLNPKVLGQKTLPVLLREPALAHHCLLFYRDPAQVLRELYELILNGPSHMTLRTETIRERIFKLKNEPVINRIGSSLYRKAINEAQS